MLVHFFFYDFQIAEVIRLLKLVQLLTLKHHLTWLMKAVVMDTTSISHTQEMSAMELLDHT